MLFYMYNSTTLNPNKKEKKSKTKFPPKIRMISSFCPKNRCVASQFSRAAYRPTGAAQGVVHYALKPHYYLLYAQRPSNALEEY